MAAGGSSRMDSPKQLLKWREDYLVNHIIHVARAAKVNSVYLVLGNQAEEIREVVAQNQLTIITNTGWQSGMSSSIKIGIASLPREVEAAFVLLVDQPFITRELLDQLITKMISENYEVSAPRVGRQQCTPVLFSRSLFPEIMRITGDKGAKALLKDRRVGWVDWPDERLLLDIDSKEDYQAALLLNRDQSLPSSGLASR